MQVQSAVAAAALTTIFALHATARQDSPRVYAGPTVVVAATRTADSCGV